MPARSGGFEAEGRSPDAFGQTVLQPGPAGGEETPGAGRAWVVFGVVIQIALDGPGRCVRLVNEGRAGRQSGAKQIGDDLIVGAAENRPVGGATDTPRQGGHMSGDGGDE